MPRGPRIAPGGYAVHPASRCSTSNVRPRQPTHVRRQFAVRPAAAALPTLSDRPDDWVAWVNAAQTDAELEPVRSSMRRGRPLGEQRWQHQTARQMALEFTFRNRGPAPRRGYSNQRSKG